MLSKGVDYLVWLVLCMGVLLGCVGPVSATEEPDIPLASKAYFPVWSPDGLYIAFQTSYNEASSDIWLIHPDGTGLERVTTDPGVDKCPAWGPNSSSLYFISHRTGEPRLWKKNFSTGSEIQVWDKYVYDYAVSHSGQEIILKSKGLVIVSSETGEWLRNLILGRGGNFESKPTWSPDDREAAFSKEFNLWVRNALDRTNLRQLTFFTGEDRLFGRPDWGSGGYIAFDLDTLGSSKLYKVKPDGTDLQCIFEEPDDGWAQHPSWSPDGSKLVFSRSLADSKELWTINPDGTGLAQLTHTVTTPIFSLEEGTYTSAQEVTISSVAGATIRYTTDGSDPTESSTLYTGPVSVEQTMTLKAKAWKTDWFPSLTKEAEYTLNIN